MQDSPEPKFAVVVVFDSLEEAQRKAQALKEIFPANDIRFMDWDENGPVAQSLLPPGLPRSVADWEISIRTRNTLRRYGYGTAPLAVRFLLYAGPFEIKGLRNFGPGRYIELKEYLKGFGIQLRELKW